MTTPRSSEPADELVRAWVSSPSSLAADDLTAIRVWAVRKARSLGRVSASDADEIADEAIARMVEAVADGRVHVSTAPAYLTRIVQNAAIDRLRRHSRETLTAAEAIEEASRAVPGADHEVVKLLDQQATVETVTRVMSYMAADGDTVAVRVLAVWLDEASASGRAPSARRVAAEARVSHPTVANVLARFANRLRHEVGDDGGPQAPPQ